MFQRFLLLVAILTVAGCTQGGGGVPANAITVRAVIDKYVSWQAIEVALGLPGG